MGEVTDYKSNFDPDLYLAQFYNEEKMGGFTPFLLYCFHEAFYDGQIRGKQLLDMGTGPSICTVISASPYVDEIFLSDYMPRNLEILRTWWEGKKHYLTNAFRYVLNLEEKGMAEKFGRCKESVEDRSNAIRSKVKDIVEIDITKKDPFQSKEKSIPKQFDIVTSSLAVDASCSSMEDYRKYLRNMLNLVKEGGHLVIFGATASYYTVGSYRFKRPYTTIDDVRDAIKENGFRILKQIDAKSSGFKLPQGLHDLTDCVNFFMLVAEKIKQDD